MEQDEKFACGMRAHHVAAAKAADEIKVTKTDPFVPSEVCFLRRIDVHLTRLSRSKKLEARPNVVRQHSKTDGASAAGTGALLAVLRSGRARTLADRTFSLPAKNCPVADFFPIPAV